MKHLLLLSAAALSFSAAAQQPTRMAELSSLKAAAPVDYQVQAVQGETVKAPATTTTDNPVVYEQPAGELRTYARRGIGLASYLGGIDKGSISGMTMKIVFGEDGQSVWFNELISTSRSPTYWLRGTLEGNKITLDPGQSSWFYDYGTYYTSYPVQRIKSNPEPADNYDIYVAAEGDITFTLADDGTITLDADPVTGEAAIGLIRDSTDPFLVEYGYVGKWLGYGDENTSFVPIEVKYNEAPADLQTQTYAMSYRPNASENRSVEMIEVGFVGNTVYVSDLTGGAVKDSWLIGQIEGDKVVFPSYQMIGEYNNYYIYYTGADVKPDIDPMTGEEAYYIYPTDQLVFDFDPETRAMSTSMYLAFTTWPVEPSVQGGIWEMDMKPFIEVPATPATPTIGEEFHPYNEWYMSGTITMTIPCVDINGEALNPEKLSIAFYIDGQQVTFSPDVYWGVPEEMTELPYGFDDGYQISQLGGGYMAIQFMDPEAQTFAVKSIYRGGGEEHESAMAYYPEAPVAIQQVQTEGAAVTYDLMGRRADAKAQGLCIENGKKVIRKR